MITDNNIPFQYINWPAISGKGTACNMPNMMEYIPAGTPCKPRIPGIPKPVGLTWGDVFAVLLRKN